MRAALFRSSLTAVATCLLACQQTNGLVSEDNLAKGGPGDLSGEVASDPVVAATRPSKAAEPVIPATEGISTIPAGPVPGPSDGPPCFPADANTIAHWTFDRIENGLVSNQGGNSLAAIPFGAPELMPGTCGNAVVLSGRGQYLDVQGWGRLIGYSIVTYDVIFKINSQRDDGTASGDMISELVNDSYWYPIGGAVVRVRNGVCQFAIASTTGWQHLTDVVPVSPQQWHHVAASFDTVMNAMTLQLDDHPPVRMTYSGTFVPSHVSTMRIGACVVDPPSRFVNGAIDEILIRGWR